MTEPSRMTYDESHKRIDQLLELAIQNQINHQQHLNAIAEKHIISLLEKNKTVEALKTIQFFNGECAKNIKTLLDYKKNNKNQLIRASQPVCQIGEKELEVEKTRVLDRFVSIKLILDSIK